MVSFTISGTLQELLSKAVAMKAVTERRKVDGWDLFQSDEEWEYITRGDGRVCPVCMGFAGRWTGEQVPVEFSSWQRHYPTHRLMENEVYPNTHESYPWLIPSRETGGCRCIMEWDDYEFVLTERLGREMEEVSR